MSTGQLYTSDDSLIEDERLKIGDELVTFTVEVNQDTTFIYICLTKDYAESLDKENLSR